MQSSPGNAAGASSQMQKEQIQQIVAQARLKREQGADEKTDPEYAKLLNILRYYNAQAKQASAQQQQQQATSGGASNAAGSSTAASVFSDKQLSSLKHQIMAFRQLATNRAVPDSLKRAIFEEDSSQPIVPVKISAAAVKEEKARLTQTQSDPDDAKPTTESNPYKIKPGPLHSSGTDLRHQRLLIPSATPSGVDPYALFKEREKVLKSKISYRIQELESLQSNIANESELLPSPINDSNLKLKALIELKSLKLLERQRKLREEILKTVGQGTTLSVQIDRSVYRRMKKQSIRDARQTEKIEQNQKMEREKREKQKTFDYINSVLSHGKDMFSFHRMAASKSVKLGQAVLKYHANAEKEEQKRLQRISQERLKALKEDDEEAYMKLIDEAKDTRITTILSQTNTYLDSLTSAVVSQKTEIAEGEELEVKLTDEDGKEIDQEERETQDYYNTAHRVKEEVLKQPDILVGGTLKDYQIKGLQWMVSLYNNRLNGILADEMGLGKTIQTISLITYLIEKKKQAGPFLVIVPLSTIANWKLEFEKWAPSVTKVVYKGSPNERKKAQNEMRAGPFNVLLTTYEYIIRDRPLLAKVKWVHMIIDEGHRMKNSQSKLSITLMQHYSSRYRIILTGTPLQNNLPELWALLNFILPKIFNSVKSFDEWFNSPFGGGSMSGNDKVELNEEESLLIIRRLHKVLRPFLLRRLKKDVESELPDKVETIIKCNMSSLQQKLTDQLRDRRSFYDGGGSGKTAIAGMKSLNNLVMQFRKICNHPYVFSEVEDVVNPNQTTDANIYRVAGKFELLDRVLPKYFATNHRCLMFFQMTQIMDIMEDYLRWRGYQYLRLDGSIKAEDRGELLKQFNAPDSPYFVFLLSTRAGGLGLNLQSADTVIIYDSDWNPHQDLQAQDRAHRIGQTKEVRIVRLVTAKSVEEHILARAQFKLDLDGKVIQAGKFDNKSSDADREELLRSLFGNENDDDKDEDDEDVSMNDDELNEILARDDSELEIFRAMDEERVSKDLTDWRELGKSTPFNNSRLMLESELPAVYLVDVNEVLEQERAAEESAIVGRGAREKKTIHYDEVLNEEQWLEAVDKGIDVEHLSNQKRAARQRRRNNNFDDVNTEDGSEEGSQPPASRGRGGRGRPRGSINKSTGGGRGRRSKHGINRNEVDPIPPAMRKAMIRVFTMCNDVVAEMPVEIEGFVRKRCELFLTLPSRTDYPDYYQLIKKPIAMDTIVARINSSYYKSVEEFKQDYLQMFTNAKTYNQEGSDVYSDAEEMQRVFLELLGRNTQNGAVPVTQQDVEAAERDRMNPQVGTPAAAAAPKKRGRQPKRKVSDYESDSSESEPEVDDAPKKRKVDERFADMPDIPFGDY